MFGGAEERCLTSGPEGREIQQNAPFVFFTIFDKVSASHLVIFIVLTLNSQYLSYVRGEEASSLFASFFFSFSPPSDLYLNVYWAGYSRVRS